MAMQADVDQILSFWFDAPDASTKWFGGGDAFDEEIRARFSSLVEQGQSDQLDSWTATPRGSLALIILLDQFSRNIYRGSEKAHASDGKAYQIAVSSIAQEYDHAVTNLQALFFYLPLMHDESVVSQIACIALCDSLVARCELRGDEPARAFVTNSIGYAKGHRDTILRFGRFPSRNQILGRDSTADEKQFLKDNPSGFL